MWFILYDCNPIQYYDPSGYSDVAVRNYYQDQGYGVGWTASDPGKGNAVITITDPKNKNSTPLILKEGVDFYVGKDGKSYFINDTSNRVTNTNLEVKWSAGTPGDANSTIELSTQNGTYIATLKEGKEYYVGNDGKAYYYNFGMPAKATNNVGGSLQPQQPSPAPKITLPSVPTNFTLGDVQIPNYLLSWIIIPPIDTFIANYPVQAAMIGNNISTRVARFASSIGLLDNNGSLGSQANAFRHVLWTTFMCRVLGVQIAFECSWAHEKNPWVLFGWDANGSEMYYDYSTLTFETLEAVDEAIDIANNLIGLSVGLIGVASYMPDVAKEVANYYYTYGFWVASEQEDGTFKMKQQLLTANQYSDVLLNIDKLDMNGNLR